MKKNLLTFNKALALLLALTLMIPAGSFSLMLTVTASANSLTVSDSELVANNYDSLSAEEKALLNSGLTEGSSYTVNIPGAEDNLISINAEEKSVSASDYVSGEFTWRPASAKLVYSGGEEDIVLDNNGKGTFEYSGNVYSVQVDYELLIPVDTAVQAKLLNGPYYLAKCHQNIVEVFGYDPTFNSLAINISSVMSLADGNPTNFELSDGKTVAAINRINDQSVANGQYLDIELLLYSYFNDIESKVEYLLTEGSVIRDSIKSTYDDCAQISNDPEIEGIISSLGKNSMTARKIQTAMRALNDLITALGPIVNDDWAILEAENNFLKSGLTADEYAELDGYVEAIEEAEYHDDEIKEKLTAGTVTVSCNVNQYNVAVTLNANVIANTTVDLSATSALETRKTTIQVLAGASAAEVVEAVANNGIEDVALAAWVDVNEENYVRTASELPEAVNEDIEYVITYEPKEIHATYGFETELPTTVPYGYNMTLPAHGGDELVYDYEIGGKRYLEGDVYKVTSDFTVNRSEGKPWDVMRVAQIVSDVYADELTEGEREVLSSAALKSDTVLLRKPTNDDGLVTITALGDGKFEVEASEYPSGIEGITWTPSAGKAVNGTDTVSGFTFTNGKAQFTADEFERVEVEYGMTLTNISDDEILEMLNIPGILAKEAADQIENLEFLDRNYDRLGELNKKTLKAIEVAVKGSDMAEESKAAVGTIIKGCVEEETAKLYIYGYLTDYRADGLAYYYRDKNYAKMSNQVKILKDNFYIVYDDPEFYNLLESMEYENYYNEIGDLLEELDTVVLSEPNALIDIYSSDLDGLVAAIEKIMDSPREFDSADRKLTLSATVSADEISQPIQYVKGDATGDGYVTMSDVLLIRKSIAGIVDLTPEQFKRADITGDGYVTMSDVLKVRKIIAGID